MTFAKKITSSLALRILLVCTLLLIIPLLLHTFVIYRQDYMLKMRELFTKLQIVGQSRAYFLQETIALRKENLHLIALTLPQNPQPFLEQIKEEESLALLTTRCDHPAVDQPHLMLDPETGEKLLVIEEALDHCTLYMGISIQSLFHQFTEVDHPPYPFSFSLLDDQEALFASDNPLLTQENLQLFTLQSTKKRTFFSKLTHLEKQGYYIGLKLPIPNTSFSLLVTVPQEAVAAVEKSKIVSRLFSLFFLTLLIATGSAIWLTRRMVRPLKALCHVMDKVSHNELTARFKEDPMGFEINLLGKNFNLMIDSLLKHMEEAKTERIARVLLENELKISNRIQRSILPKKMPELADVDLAALLQPAKEVAGDFYDIYLKKAENSLLITIADASDKGVSACLYSLSIRGMLRSAAATCTHLPKLITLTNDLFCLDTGDSGNFVSAWIGKLDLTTQKLEYCSCGHPPALLKRPRAPIQELTSSNMALGVMPFKEVETHTIQLYPGDLLLLYTDGLTEAQNKQMQFLGRANVLELLDHTQDASAQEIIQYFMQNITRFSEGSSLKDDLTLLVMKIL